MRINKDYLPEGHRNRPGYAMKPVGLLFHTTNNWDDGAGDEMHAEYMENTDRVVSWHDTVDENSCTLHIPHNENAWHAGDGGSGHYNRNWIGMEIACEDVDRGQKLDKETYNNAVTRAAQICKEHGFGWGQLQPHNVVYGKNCPHDTLFDRNQFKKDVFAKIASNEKDNTTVKKAGGIHVVREGDTLSEIAAKYDTTVDALVKLNDIKDKDVISIGQKIKLGASVHTVKPGDTLSEIAATYDTSVDYLVRLNGIDNPNLISIGQNIKLKGSAPKAKPKAPVKPADLYIDGIRVRGKIEIVNVKWAAYICKRPSSNSDTYTTISKGAKIEIAGSVPGWWEVIYQGNRAYVNEKYGRLL